MVHRLPLVSFDIVVHRLPPLGARKGLLLEPLYRIFFRWLSLLLPRLLSRVRFLTTRILIFFLFSQNLLYSPNLFCLLEPPPSTLGLHLFFLVPVLFFFPPTSQTTSAPPVDPPLPPLFS